MARAQKPTRNQIVSNVLEYAENCRRNAGKPKLPPVFKEDRVFCSFPGCNQMLDILTYAHAAKHGFDSKEDLIKAGYIRKVGEIDE